MLQAASLSLAHDSHNTISKSKSNPAASAGTSTTAHHHHPSTLHTSSLSALLNPVPLGIAASLPSGFVLGKDGKIKKKRGRKPTPGLSDEDRRNARLLKNRRTAELSRRRKLLQLEQLTEQRDHAKQFTKQLKSSNQYLINKLAKVLNISVDALIQSDPTIAANIQRQQQHDDDLFNCSHHSHSDISHPGSVVDSDDDDGSVGMIQVEQNTKQNV